MTGNYCLSKSQTCHISDITSSSLQHMLKMSAFSTKAKA